MNEKMTKRQRKESLDSGWDVTVTGRHVHVTDAMKDYAIEKISKIERFGNRILEAQVVMDIQKKHHRVDIVVKINTTRIKAQAVTEDMYASVDKAVDKLNAQLTKYKTKLQDHHAKGLAVIDMTVNVLQRSVSDLDELNEEIEEENLRRAEETFKPHDIVAQETRPLRILNYDEAIMKMELSGDLFMVFRNEASNKLEVIYRRHDGHFGVIQPE